MLTNELSPQPSAFSPQTSAFSPQPSSLIHHPKIMSVISDSIQSKCLAFGDRIIKLNDYLLEQASTKAEGRGRKSDVSKSAISHHTSAVVQPSAFSPQTSAFSLQTSSLSLRLNFCGTK